MAKRIDDEAHLEALRALCEQADKLRQVAEELCQRLTKRMEATRAAVHQRSARPERRRGIRKHR
jgi:hypothetical protein